MVKRLWASEKGVLLPWVLILLGILSIIVVVTLTLVTNQFVMGSRFSSSVKAFHYAEAGIHHYLAYINSEDSSSQGPPLLNEDIAYEDGYYRLEVINDDKSNEVTIRSTGWPKDPVNEKSDLRTVDVVLKKRSFTEHVYFSDNDGDDIWWTDGEKCFGPYHTNTTLRVKGRPVFYGPVSYVKNIVYHSSGSNPDFRKGASRVAPINFPTTNTKLKILAQSDGYLFEGRTSIMLNADGTITVRNQNINNWAPKKMALPNNGVIYVNGTTSSYDKRFNAGSGNAFVSGTLKGRLTIAASNDIYITGKDPTKWIPDKEKNQQGYFDSNQVTPTGGIKLAATTFSPVYERNELTGYKAVGNDILGLVANNYIRILTRGWFKESGSENTGILSYPQNLTIHAALFAINGSFENKDYQYYPPSSGKLTLRGALIQKTRGPVGLTSGKGYIKDYAHDNRMLYDAPPHFLEPEKSGWEVFEWSESRTHLNDSEDN